MKLKKIHCFFNDTENYSADNEENILAAEKAAVGWKMKVVLAFYAVSIAASAAAIFSKYFFVSAYRFIKPLPVAILVIMLLYLSFLYNFSAGSVLIIFGLICGLAGDVFLLDEERYILPGMVAFMIGHVFYGISFITFPLHFHPFIVVLAVFAVFYLYSIKTLLAKSSKKNLFVPVAFYVAVIFFMNFSAQSCDIASGGLGILSLGAALFVVSDSVLAWRFLIGGYSNFTHAIILATYFSSQMLIAYYAVRQIFIFP